ncbi:hypothetical protein Vi05172_g6437 [Venturia inaequalis]|nr:hypothetical protein Vi05172_g6437 [Venturia inaequalis]
MKLQSHHSHLLSLLLLSSCVSAVRQCTSEDRTRDLKPGQCLTQCAGSNGKVTCPGDPPTTVRQDDCDFLTVVRDTNGKVIDRCCTRNPEKPTKKRPQCGKNVGWLECDPDNGFGSCCSRNGLCGSGEEYCGRGDGSCDSQCDKCPGPRRDKRCGKDFDDAVCQQGQCCSARGWCGTSDNHCKVENGCQGSCKPSGVGANRCGTQAGGRVCDPAGEFGDCCSKNGFCGTSHAHCDKNQGCQSGCDDPEPPPRRPDTQTPLIPTRPPPKKTRDDEDPDSPTKPPPKKTRDDEDPDSPTKPPPKRIRDDEDPDPPTRPPPKKTRDDEDPDSPSKPPPKRTRDDEDPDSPTKPPPKKTRDDEDPDSPTRPPPKKTRDDEDPDSPTRPPPKKTRDDEDPDSPSKPPPKKTRDDEDCPKCPACPKTECPPPPKKNPSSVPKFHDSTANTVLSCLCDEGEEPTAHKLAPQKLGCNWKHGQQIHIRGRCYQYECFTWQASGVHEKVPGDSLEHCGELCVADKRCWSINFFHEHPATGGKPACSLHVGASEPSEYPVKQGNWVYGGSLKKC